jgi:hypothetical protein
LEDFFENLEKSTFALLSKEPILESLSGTFSTPRTLKYVPELFSDSEGIPLINTAETRPRYLSSSYSREDRDVLVRLGISYLTSYEFLEDLTTFIRSNPLEFQNMPYAWHSQVSKVLTTILDQSLVTKSAISRLNIVPLRDGRWVSADSSSLLFPNKSKDLVVPQGIDVAEVHPDVIGDRHRKTLLERLGAKPFRPQRICDIIVETHKRPEFRSKKHPIADLVAHAEFMFKLEWINPGTEDLWFASEGGSYGLGSEMYADSNLPLSATKYFAKNRGSFLFLHPAYYKLEEITWRDWLVNNANVSNVPRFVYPTMTAPFSMSRDMKFIIEHYLVLDFLLLLKHHWNRYSNWLEPNFDRDENTAWKDSRWTLREQVGSLQAPCLDGTTAPLNQTFLPVSNIVLDPAISLSFLAVPEPDDLGWSFLRHLGVTTKLGVNVFIQTLKHLRKTSQTVEKVSMLYSQMYAAVSTDMELVR